MTRIFAGLLATAMFTGTGWAQQAGVWLQVEAQPTLGAAQERVRDYAARLEDVNGYYLRSGWYAIAVGPYTATDAETLRVALRAGGQIPSDSFVVDGSQFQQQFWPIGVGVGTAPQPLPGNLAPTPDAEVDIAADVVADGPPVSAEQPDAKPEPAAQEPVVPQPALDETPREAQASEAELSRPQKEQLQIALQWAGVYESTIDGLFGRGTRNAMAAWQDANGYEPTGVLTTRQRGVLLAAYNAVLDGMDLQLVRDEATGIEMQIPTGVVAFAEFQPPFARFDATGDLEATVLFISQPGDQDRLFGLYEIMQTLEIVPPEGPRERRNSGFTLEGIGGGIHSYTEVGLEDGQIKGFTLVWPAGDEERRSRVLAQMRASFARIDGVLDPATAVPGEDQAVDLVSGLAVRQPRLSRSGFYIDARGDVLTVAEAVDGCTEIVIDGAYPAQVVHRDDALGLAVLRPEAPLAPLAVVSFQTGVPRIRAEIAVAGYPYGGVLAAPALTFGRLEDIRGLNGEEEVKRLSLDSQPGDAGGPVFDNGGAVLGMLLPRAHKGGQVLPPEVQYSVDAPAILASLSAAGVAVQTTASVAALTPELLTRAAGDVTVLVSCWD